MSEGGRDGQFLPGRGDEQQQASPIDERYESVVPDEARLLFTEAGIVGDIKSVLGRSMELASTDEGRLSDSDRSSLEKELGRIYCGIDAASLDELKKKQIRGALNDFVAVTPVEGVGTLEEALGYNDPSEEKPNVSPTTRETAGESDTTDPDIAATFEARSKDLLKAIGISADIPHFETLVRDLEGLERNGNKELNEAQIEVIQKRWRDLGIRKSQAQEMLELSGVSESNANKILEGIPEKIDDEINAEQEVQERATQIMAEEDAKRLGEEANKLIDELPEGEDKENWRARLARWNLKLEEMGAKKVILGAGRGAFIALLAVIVALVWAMQLANKASKKK